MHNYKSTTPNVFIMCTGKTLTKGQRMHLCYLPPKHKSMQSNLATVLCHQLCMDRPQESLQLQCNLLLKDLISRNTTYAELLKFTHLCINYRFESFTALTLNKSTVFCDGIPCSNRIAKNAVPPPYCRTGNHLPGPLFHSRDGNGTLLQMSVVSHQTNVPP
jgi:hypothetical protein